MPPASLKAGRLVAWVLTGIFAVGLLITIWVGARGYLAYQHLARIQSGAATTASAITTDPASATPDLAALAADAAAAHDLTSDPIWKIAQQTPWIGPQLAAFASVAEASDDLLRLSLLPLATAADGLSLDALRPVDGRVDPTLLSALAEPAQQAASGANAAAASLSSVPRTPLLGAVRSAVDRSSALVTQAATAIDGLSRTAQLMPTMLGKDGPRDYLLLVQNNAEWRSLGGITGTAIHLRADQGKITLVDTQSATALSSGSTGPSVDLPTSVTDIYDTKPARYFHNLTQIPDFAFDGPLAREMYALKTGVEVDGVFAIDPVALSYLLSATGPVKLPTGDTLDGQNAVQFLLNEVYLRYAKPAEQDAVFAGAAGAVFQGLLDGQGSAGGMISALSRAGNEHRFLMWSADRAEQAIIEDTTIAGPLPTTDDRTARYGVYLNDATGSKMSYYVRPDVSVSWGSCGPVNGSAERTIVLGLTLTSNAPADAATSLPWYITGGGLYGTPPGIAKVVPNVYLPEGFELVSATSTDGSGFREADYEGHHVLTFGTELAPGGSTTLTVTARGISSATTAEAYVTPTADASLRPVVSATCAPS